MMAPSRWLPGLLLALLAAGSGILLWQLRDPGDDDQLLGPPRSDYLLIDYELIALDDAGRESFSARGPLLARHPQLGSLDLGQPLFEFPDQNGGRWTARAEAAWVDGEGEELRLMRDVEVDGPANAAGDPISLRSERLDLFPQQNLLTSDERVTVTGPGSILRGRGLRADLAARRIELFSEVSARYVDIPR